MYELIARRPARKTAPQYDKAWVAEATLRHVEFQEPFRTLGRGTTPEQAEQKLTETLRDQFGI